MARFFRSNQEGHLPVEKSHALCNYSNDSLLLGPTTDSYIALAPKLPRDEDYQGF
uniref:Uncharacterized protein n=1 Tax=Oryza sativa subsp. japonica TaxID=39947 RepID=Q84SM5_ORYSJ|nr:hypothetical protein [Oryza sativa Japonica Group]